MNRLEEEMRDFKEDCRQDALEDAHEAKKLVSDYEYALENSGIDELYDLVHIVKKNMHTHGWYDTTTKDILEYIDDNI